MAAKAKMGKSWQYRFQRKGLLPKHVYVTFDNEEEGDRFAERCEHLLDQGIVPAALKTANGRSPITANVTTIRALALAYQREKVISRRDDVLLKVIARDWGDQRLGDVGVAWVDEWIATLKRERLLSPATITSYVGALARAVDWGLRKGHMVLDGNPLRTLPMGYAQYAPSDVAATGGIKLVNLPRDRRLVGDEYERIGQVIARGELPRKQRPRPFDVAAVQLLVDLALETAMRMREMYTLTLDQVDLDRRTVFLDKTKNGDKRQVPLTSVAVAKLKVYLAQRDPKKMKFEDALFPFWNGSFEPNYLHQLTNEVSQLYQQLFDLAECDDLHFHDLRHEATSRFVERTNLLDVEIMKITGHKTFHTFMRYANLRGSNLATKLW